MVINLLVRTPNWLGDAVMSFSAVNGILKKYPDTGLWAHSRVAGLYRIVFPHTAVHCFPSLPANHNYQHLLLMPGSFSSALAGVKAGIRKITGTPGEARSPLLTTIRRIPADRSRHHSLHYEALAETIGAFPEPVSPPELNSSGKPHAAVFAGARYGDAKVWKGFGKLTGLLNHSCVFYGTVSETDYLSEISAGTGAVVSTGNTMADLCSSLLSASVAVGNDSGGIHLAAFLGVPSVALFGSTSPAWTAPSGTSVRIIRGSAECSPCFSRTCRLKTPECLESINPEVVANAVRELVDG